MKKTMLLNASIMLIIAASQPTWAAKPSTGPGGGDGGGGGTDTEVLPDARSLLGTLNDKTIPLPSLDGIVIDKPAAIRLGKALFWDVAVGSDRQACASCHFQAGADPRITNQLSPGFLDKRDIDQNSVSGDQSFGGLVSSLVPENDRSPQSTMGLTPSGQIAEPNITLTPNDFPTHQLSDIADRNSSIIYTTNDVISSMGTYDGSFISLESRKGKNESLSDVCNIPSGDVFHVQGLPTRRVEPRNTPTTINAVFNFRNFWDGRANNIFNGVDVFGRRDTINDPRARVLVSDIDGNTSLQALELKNGSLASQAMGPPRSDFEMSCAGRTFADIGRKLLLQKPLLSQKVSRKDSVLGSIASKNGLGLNSTYKSMIKKAFSPKYTEGNAKFVIDASGNLLKDTSGYTKQELNFPLYWGISVMLYEASLVNDDSQSAFGRFMASDDSALNNSEKNGLNLFVNKGKCVNCHSGPTLSKAAIHLQAENQEEGLVERMLMADPTVNVKPALYDNGFYNIGVTPTVQDIAVGGVDPYGSPLSFTRQFLDKLRGIDAPDPFEVDPCTFEEKIDSQISPCDSSAQIALIDPDTERVAVDGAFKTPNLLNIALTPPYFHNGSAATLEQVVDFYDRGGNRRGNNGDDNSGTGKLGDKNPIDPSPKGSNLDPDITQLNLSSTEKSDLVAFLKTLTDERVRCDKAPFDHPSLSVPVRHTATDDNGDGKADTVFATLDAVGASGFSSTQCIPNTGNLFDMQGRLN